MALTLIDPRNEGARPDARVAPRLATLTGATLALLDISKPGGRDFLNRLETLLKEEYGVVRIVRATKPTYARPAPDALLETLRHVNAVVVGLAD